MANKIQLDVVTPEKLVISDEVDIVVAPGALGEFGVLAGHIPFLSTLTPGEMRFTRDGQVEYMAVGSGFAEVQPEKVTVLADTAELAREIDIDRA
ncbi:MAG: F0F1 ATP synthase subunit epsilon, partial [Deltaproteobacteria bacterium]|nr:F0F1 ATP synthase subunit epsilon [Deltaproteobacteria bacterium]